MKDDPCDKFKVFAQAMLVYFDYVTGLKDGVQCPFCLWIQREWQPTHDECELNEVYEELHGTASAMAQRGH